MNRELKFRVWDNVNKSFTRSSRHFIDTSGLLFTDCDPTGIQMNGTRKIVCKPNQYALAGQYTGLNDKNRQEIYEGDICKCYDHPTGIEDSTGVVIFDGGRYWIEGGSSLVSLDDFGTAWTEIIGNIHQNPELVNRTVGV